MKAVTFKDLGIAGDFLFPCQGCGKVLALTQQHLDGAVADDSLMPLMTIWDVVVYCERERCYKTNHVKVSQNHKPLSAVFK